MLKQIKPRTTAEAAENITGPKILMQLITGLFLKLYPHLNTHLNVAVELKAGTGFNKNKNYV